MKKSVTQAMACLLLVVLLCGSMAGCGTGDNPPPPQDTQTITPIPTQQVQESEPAAPALSTADQELAQIQKVYDVLEGKAEADLFLKNVQIVDVYREKTAPGTLLILDGRIIAIDPDEDIVKAKQVVDGGGQYALPGLIDGHFHFESQLVTPTQLAGAMVPHGTTSIIAECCDFVSAAGENAIPAAQTLFQGMEELPYRIYPFAPGKKVPYETVKIMLDWDFILGLGEMNNINFSNGNEEDFQKVAYTKSLGKLLDGHVDGGTNNRENFAPAVNIMNDHDIWSGDSLENNLKLGLPSFLLYGMGRVTPLVTEILERDLPTDNIMFSTDNLAVEHMVKTGHMDACLNEAMDVGLDPITAIKMCTYNTAKHFGLEEEIGSLAPGRYADIVLTSSLYPLVPTSVYQNGVLVAQDGVLEERAKANLDYSSLVKPSTRGVDDLKEEDLLAEPIERSEDGTQAKVMVYNYYGFGETGYFKEEWLEVKDGVIVPELNGEPLLHYAVVQRYSEGQRVIHTGYLRQFPLEQGAVTVAFSAPKPYMITFGVNTADMLVGIRTADEYNGAYILSRDGTAVETVQMDIYGMMTDFTVEELGSRSEAFTQALADMGHVHDSPILMSLLELFYLSDRYGLLA
ncbi:MAG: adenine deaminase [Oscillospiraceae bacterium]|nr:adenine deaminase [Oscillospiraceae bacterium]